ncbi:MAG: histidine phosphatase family protein [Anaerolineae bacterium]
MTTFYLVRHGNTVWNRDIRFRGRTDLPLDETGLAQARATAQALANVGLAAVFASPLKRAFNTAELIAQAAGLVARPLPDLMDIDFGEWQGMSPAEVEKAYPELYRRYLEAPHLVHFPGGESLEGARARFVQGVLKVAEMFPEQKVCLVAHQAVNRVLLTAVLGLGTDAYWRINQDTCCINVFHYDPTAYRFTVERLNDTHHLAHLG